MRKGRLPRCFGRYWSDNPECKACSYRDSCEEFTRKEEEKIKKEIMQCIASRGKILGVGPKCIFGGCPYWGGDGICLLRIETEER